MGTSTKSKRILVTKRKKNITFNRNCVYTSNCSLFTYLVVTNHFSVIPSHSFLTLGEIFVRLFLKQVILYPRKLFMFLLESS